MFKVLYPGVALVLMIYASLAFSATYLENGLQHKPHAPINMQFKMAAINSDKIQINQEVTIEITFENTIDTNELIVNFDTDKNLTLLSDNQYYFGLQAAHQKNSVTLKVKPEVDGLLYVNISAHLINQGKHQSRSFAIPVKVAQSAETKRLKFKNNKNELKAVNGIISMPAIKR